MAFKQIIHSTEFRDTLFRIHDVIFYISVYTVACNMDITLALTVIKWNAGPVDPSCPTEHLVNVC